MVGMPALLSGHRTHSAENAPLSDLLIGGPAMPHLTARPRELVTRRGLLQVGSLAMLGLSLPQYLWARDALQNQTSRRRREKSCIFIVQYGGASHIDTWDPKPDAPGEMRGPYKPIATSVTGLRFGDLLPLL